jgi:hypothetical protein
MKRTLDAAAVVLTSLLLLGFAVLSFRGPGRPAACCGPLRCPGVGCIGRAVLSRLSVPQPRHRRDRRDLSAVAAVEAVGHCGDDDGGAAAVRHVGALAERNAAARSAPHSPGADRAHRRAAVATGPDGRGLAAAERVSEGFRRLTVRSPPPDLGARLFERRFDEAREIKSL